ncbi:sigma-70 family RNA polymerase sigma factor [Pelagicoccus sp. SDUM812002]|uniref:sigma-70 family RNA polymerase sigma factor n=1 Tax=Pelagicoccus sp. SDUM812002 TaxID=3041266 RepID=UPI00280E0B5E|nr:sigma-70 family RNA polymerase sigma factor [Pelagicoccus sp. SDUM812002]MDQ8186829.1 sigma-70 family RNA polymerase sigma factor [Pelagicoccus sp. SDUM812002]
MNLKSEQLSDLTDADLLQESGKGSRDAFRILYRRISKALYSAAFKFTGNGADADELMQETFLELWKQAPKYDASLAQPLTFASRIIRNRAIDRIRKKTRRGRIVEDSKQDILELTQSAPLAGAFENLRASEAAQVVRKAFDVLTEDQRQVLQLAYFGGLSQSEIADRESQALGTVKSRIRRGLERLRVELEGKL